MSVQNINLNDIHVGVVVLHKKFGTGVVIKIGDNTISVKFNGFDKIFQYPEALLQGFLKTV